MKPYSFLPVLRCRSPLPGCFALALLLCGCAADIMRGYVGRPPEAVMARYGPPVDVRDLPDGRRAYQWMQSEFETSGGDATTRVERGGNGHPRSRTEYTPTTTRERKCFYTFYARRAAYGWQIEDFERPEFGC
ncbi:hypothetical protein ACG3SL_12790 [Sphingomonas sp. CJ20]